MPIPTTDVTSVSILGNDIIRLGFHLIPYIAHTVVTTLPSSTYVFFTDSHLAPLYLESFEREFALALEGVADKPRFLTRVIPPGEQSKCRQTKAELEDWMLSERVTRDAVVLALGGGVVGDLIGYLSATYMRGVRYCQISTTLLGMVDSSIGGKVSFAWGLRQPCAYCW